MKEQGEGIPRENQLERTGEAGQRNWQKHLAGGDASRPEG
jgi:hypothetical protein